MKVQCQALSTINSCIRVWRFIQAKPEVNIIKKLKKLAGMSFVHKRLLNEDALSTIEKRGVLICSSKALSVAVNKLLSISVQV